MSARTDPQSVRRGRADTRARAKDGPGGPVPVRVIGCGSGDRGDDAAGFIAVRALRRRLQGRPDVQMLEAATGLHVLDMLEGARAVIVVDAVHSSCPRPAGTVIRVEAGPAGLPAELTASVSTHGLGVGEAIALAGVLDRLPRTVFLGLQVASIAPGDLLSTDVAAAMPAFVDTLEHEVQSLLAEVAP